MVDTIYVPDVGEVAQQGGTVTTDGQGRASAPIATSVTITPAANQRVSSQSGDFVAGAITDLATLLALAGASGDANTVASLMGRLTRIRDYLALASTAAKQPTLGTGVMTGSAPVTIATDDTVFAELLTDTDNLATIAGAISGARVQSDISRVLGATLSASNPVLQESAILNMIRNGQGFSATTGKLATATNGNLTEGMSVFNPTNSGKDIFIYSVRINAKTAGYHQMNLTTTDPAFATTLTPVNMKAGGAASVASVTCSAAAATASVAVTGTIFDEFIMVNNATADFIPSGSGVLLPKGAATNGLATLLNIVTATDTYFVTYRWVEF